MKKTTTSNPLKFFNDAKAARNKSFNKSLKRMDNGGGSGMGRMAADDAAFDAMINKAGSTSSYRAPEPSKTSKNVVYQGPISGAADEEIYITTRANPGMTNYNTVRANDIMNASRNPKNSKIQEKYDSFRPKISKESKKAAKEDRKN
jgi:hypothetical protein